jgi:hypothetical protein
MRGRPGDHVGVAVERRILHHRAALDIAGVQFPHRLGERRRPLRRLPVAPGVLKADHLEAVHEGVHHERAEVLGELLEEPAERGFKPL